MATPPRARTQHRSRSPLVLDISRLGRRPGSMLELHQAVPSPSRIGLDLIAIERDADLNLDLRLESVSEGVLVTGTVHALTRGECSRCLTPVTGDVEIALTELFAYPDSATESTTEADEVGHVVDQTIDLEQSIVDAVGLALPFAPLCSEDCPGLCPECGVPLAGAEPDHHHDQIDPRFAKLANMFPADEETTPERGGRRFVTPPRENLLNALGVDMGDELLTLALTHRSYAYEHGGLPTNERLEFLGDAVLGLTVTDELFHRHPDRSEGDLAKLRASIVNTQALADVGRGLTEEGLGAYLLLGRGEINTGGADKSSILADGMESLLGAVYLQHGIETARKVILTLFANLLDTAPTLGAGLDWKTSLQELSASKGLGPPAYVVTSTGPDHDKQFTATVVVNDVEYGAGVGRSKKEAEQKAAAKAWQAITNQEPDA